MTLNFVSDLCKKYMQMSSGINIKNCSAFFTVNTPLNSVETKGSLLFFILYNVFFIILTMFTNINTKYSKKRRKIVSTYIIVHNNQVGELVE